MGKVLLLTSLASYQVDDGLVLQLRQTMTNDADLLAPLAWGSYATCNRLEPTTFV